MKKKIVAIIISCLMMTSSIAVFALEDDGVINDTSIEEIEMTPLPTPTEVVKEEIKETKEDKENIKEPTEVVETPSIDKITEETEQEWMIDEVYANYIAMNDEEKVTYFDTLTLDQKNCLMEYIDEQANKIEDQPFSAEQLYDQYMAYESNEEKEVYFNGLSKDQQALLQTFIDSNTNTSDKTDTMNEVQTPAKTSDEVVEKNTSVNFADAAPLLPPVSHINRMMRVTPKNMDMSSSEFVVDKSVSDVSNDQNQYALSMEAYTEKETHTSMIIPSDIILLLDQSGSMDCNFSNYPVLKKLSDENRYEYRYGDTKQKAVQQISADFVLSMNEYKGDNKIAIVTFADNASRVLAYSNDYGDTYKWDSDKYLYEGKDVGNLPTGSDVHGRFIDKGREGSVANTLLNLPISLNSGHTETLKGLRETQKLLEENITTLNGEKRNQVVIFMSDGMPNMFDEDKDNNSIIKKAKELKDQGATIYVIGIFKDANPQNKDEANLLMNYISSNYPNATSMNDLGESVNNGYYLSAKNTNGLSAIFKNIEEEISKPTQGTETEFIMKDVVTDYFKLTETMEEAGVTINKVACTGYDEDLSTYTWGESTLLSNEGLTYDPETKTVSVSGFDFNTNYVSKIPKSDGSYGYKLSLSFNVQVEDNFMGGINVPTNKDVSGIYEKTQEGNEILIETFPIPTLDIEPKLEVDVEDQSIYLGNSLKYNELMSEIHEKFNGINNAFMDVSFKVVKDNNQDGMMDSSDEVIHEWNVLHHESVNIESISGEVEPENRTQYLVEYRMIPIDAKEDQKCKEYNLTEHSPFAIHVLKPTIDFHDVYVDYGTSVDFINDCADGSLVYNYDDKKDIISLSVDINTYQPLDNKGNLLSNDGYYLIDDEGNHLNQGVSKEVLESAKISEQRPSSIVWMDDETIGTVSIPLAQGQKPPMVTYLFKNNDGQTYTAKKYYNQRSKQEEQFFPYQFTTQTTDDKKVQHTYILNDEQQEPFNIYLNTYDLIIEKTIEADAVNKYMQDIVFTISYTLEDNFKELEVVLPSSDFVENEDGSYTATKMILDLYAGISIDIEEDANWSWRLNLDKYSASESIGNLEANVTLINNDSILNLFTSYSKNYSEPLNQNVQRSSVHDYSDLVRKVGSRLPVVLEDKGVVILKINNIASLSNDDWMSDQTFTRNVFTSNEVSE